MIRTEKRSCPFACVIFSVHTPGLRCSCETITRSAPLMMNAPSRVISGTSPRYTSSSRTSSPSFRRKVACSGAEKVSPSRSASKAVFFGFSRL